MRLMLFMLSLLFAVGCAKTVPNPNPNAEIIERYTKEAQAAIERERVNPSKECAYEVPDDCDLRLKFAAAERARQYRESRAVGDPPPILFVYPIIQQRWYPSSGFW